MYCPKCGTENPEGVQLCRSCSWVMTGTATVALNPDAKTSGLATTALVLAILSPFTCMLTVIPAVIFGIVALVKIEKSGGTLKGKGLAIAGLAAPAALFPFACMMGIMMPMLAQTRHIAYRMVCGNNLGGLTKAMIVYAGENGDKYPTSSQWCDLLMQNMDIPAKQFRCKGASEGPCNYAMNINIEKLGPDAPPDMVLLFESKPGWNQAGGPELLTIENHQGKGCNVAFNDTHVEFVLSKDVNDLKWTDEQK